MTGEKSSGTNSSFIKFLCPRGKSTYSRKMLGQLSTEEFLDLKARLDGHIAVAEADFVDAMDVQEGTIEQIRLLEHRRQTLGNMYASRRLMKSLMLSSV